MTELAEWSPADADGVRTLTIGFGARASLRGQRFRRCPEPNIEALAVCPGEWRDLLREWLKAEVERTRWSTLLKVAGPPRVTLAQELIAALVRAGFAEVEERRERTRWALAWVRFLHADMLRDALGLPDAAALAQTLEQLRSRPLLPALAAAGAAAMDSYPAIAVRRLTLLDSLEAWGKKSKRGTRRDFALFATGHTKGLADSDWSWLQEFLDLEALGIEQHIPLLLIRAPLVLQGSDPLDIRGVSDCVGLSPATIQRTTGVQGNINSWWIIENRTLFDRVARQHGNTDGVIWVPGYPPEWWKRATEHLLGQRPSKVHIACDPDPSGIQIALVVGRLCEEANVEWTSWGMDVAALESLPAFTSLTPDDTEKLRRLLSDDLPPELRQSAQWMLERQLKGEQEGLSLPSSGLAR